MSAKKTKLIVAELRVLALILANDYWCEILGEAADRLEDTEKIAEFYHKELEKRSEQ